MKKTIMLNAKLEIDSKYEITDEVITDILKGIDCWSDVHNIDNKLYFDFAIIDEQQQLLGLIEYDGEQHYNPNLGGWFTGTYDDLHRRDIIKDNYCQTHNYKLYRIRYDEDVNKRMEEIISELRC